MNRPAYPKRIVIELTPRCNLSCPMCPGQYLTRRNGYISEALWKRLVDEIAEVDPTTVILPFWRGESLTHLGFFYLMKYALDRSLRIHISTNGQVLTKEHSDVLAGCEFVTFSVHTMKGYKNAERFISLRKEGGPAVQVSFVKGEETAEKLLKDITAEPDLRGFDSVRLYEEHTKDGVFGSSSAPAGLKRIFCNKLLDTLVISHDGMISRCNHIWETSDEIDLNSSDIKEAWGSNHLKGICDNYPDEKCGPCDQWIGHTLGESWRIIDGETVHRVYSAHN